ncbi:hypothetical protein [Paenibacillus odorifer]|uniref:hypothetical protein n=1 Tax=Paenibacillus odorifer TaxID=189426 RepID=UPI001C4DA73C|nr:hypothetical protein [Paenibacillus odorifer]
MPKTDLEIRFWQTSDHSHPYSAGLASTLPTGFGVAHLRLDLACTLPIGLGEHTSDWTSLLADRNYHFSVKSTFDITRYIFSARS